jgi:hypothetical protein
MNVARLRRLTPPIAIVVTSMLPKSSAGRFARAALRPSACSRIHDERVSRQAFQ